MKNDKKETGSITRKSFLKKSAIATSFLFVPRHVLGGVGFTAPSDQLNIAAIGAGGKGSSDIQHASVNGRERVAALCDVDFSGSAQRSVEAFPEAKRYSDYREMLEAEPDLDAVTISTPDHNHAPAAKYAMELGIHVYVQKPMIREARLLTEMAREKKIVTQMGNQGASNPLLNMVQGWIDSGKLGKISEVNVWTNRPVWPQGFAMPEPDPSQKPDALDWDLWLGPAEMRPYTPNLHPFNWRGWWDYGTGALGDVGCHLIDIPYRTLGLTYPTDAECSVGTIYTEMWTPDYHPEGCPASSFITMHYEATDKTQSPVTMTWSDGGIKPSRPEIIPADHDMGGNNSANACKAGFDSKEHRELTSSFDYAGPMTETVLMGNLAIRSYLLRRENSEGRLEYYGRKKLLWDGENTEITNLKQANQFVGRTYRKGWEV